MGGQGGCSQQHTASTRPPQSPFSLGRWVQILPNQKVHTCHDGIVSKTKSFQCSCLRCHGAVPHSITLRGLWRLSGPYSEQGHLQGQRRLPSLWASAGFTPLALGSPGEGSLLPPGTRCPDLVCKAFSARPSCSCVHKGPGP